MNKRWIKITIALLIVLGTLYTLLNYTTRGRVLSLYAFGGFKAPVSVKIDCAKETDDRVATKFMLPLDFDKASKNALREYWHFSYYRACLFEAGYDFGGDKIHPSEITADGDMARYTNYFAGITFMVPKDTIIVEDNATDPDIEDRKISSTLQTGEHLITVFVYRSFNDTDSFEELEENFSGFTASTGSVVEKTVTTNQMGASVLSIYQDDGLFGFTTITPQNIVVKIFGEKLPKSLLDLIESSFEFL